MKVYRFGYVGVSDIEKFIEEFVEQKIKKKEAVSIKEYEDGSKDVEIEAIPSIRKNLHKYGYLSSKEVKENVDYYLVYEL